MNNLEKNPKIIHIISNLSTKASGPSYSVTRLCESLIKRGNHISLIALNTNVSLPTKRYLKTFPVSYFQERIGLSFAMESWLADQAKSNKIDLLHSHGLWMMPNIYPSRIGKRSNIPVVISPRGTLSKWAFSSGSMAKKLFWPFLQLSALKNANCFHATSYSEYQDIRRMGFKQPVAIIPNGIDIPSFNFIKESNSMRTLLFLSRIHPVKGLEPLLEAWQKVAPLFPNWQLKIIGPDNNGYLYKIKDYAKKLNLKRIFFADPVYDELKYIEYKKADLFILPSFSENFGMVVAEALASGTPVIVGKETPWSDLEQNGAGWWIDINKESLINCLTKALECSKDELMEMGKIGRDWMIKDFTWKENANDFTRLYNWIHKGGKAPDFIKFD